MILSNGEIGLSLTQKEQEAYDQPTLCNGDETYEIVEANAEHDFKFCNFYFQKDTLRAEVFL